MRLAVSGSLVSVALGACGPGGGGAVETDDESGTDDGGSSSESSATPPPVLPDANGLVDCGDIVSGAILGPGSPGPTGFPEFGCSPRESGAGEWKCCSDDPAAESGALPNYANNDIPGSTTPYFSGPNNAEGSSGMCVRTAELPAGTGLIEDNAASCPIPCNPTWDDPSIAAVCGDTGICCQSRELQAADCVATEDGSFRPVSGADIGALTDWSPGAHATHQDPGGVACSESAEGDLSNAVFVDCIAQLTVADQRGFCLALAPGQTCPLDQPTYVNACEAL